MQCPCIILTLCLHNQFVYDDDEYDEGMACLSIDGLLYTVILQCNNTITLAKHLAKKIRRRDRAYSRCKCTGRLEEERKFESLKWEVQHDLRRAYWSHLNDIVTPQESDPNSFNSMKRFWRFIKCKATDFIGVASLKVNGKLINDPKLSQFQGVFTHETVFSQQSVYHQ